MIIKNDPIQGDQEASDIKDIRYVDINQKSVFQYLSLKLVITVSLL